MPCLDRCSARESAPGEAYADEAEAKERERGGLRDASVDDSPVRRLEAPREPTLRTAECGGK
jgi:hypothetical protein